MKVVFHDRFREVYAGDPAAAPGRLDGIVAELRDGFEFVEPAPAGEEDLLLVHHPTLVERVKAKQPLYETAVLAVGGAITAAEIAMRGEPAFALVRPPGHHAGPSSCWGFCWFNNVAVAVERLRKKGDISKALIVDIDLHFGDGTDRIFAHIPEVAYHHLSSTRDLMRFFKSNTDCDLVAVSAGFDGHVEDWGGLLETGDYLTLGKMIGAFARRVCGGRVFGALEGGYNHEVLGKNVKAFLTGLRQM